MKKTDQLLDNEEEKAKDILKKLGYVQISEHQRQQDK